MRKIKVLYGFGNEKFMGNVEKALKGMGRESLCSIRPTKDMLKEFIASHPDLDVVVLKEYLDGGGQYGIEEFISLTQHTNVRFIILIGENYRGRKELAELYAEGILDALFSDGKKGIDSMEVAELIVHGRTRAEAKKYYRIQKGVTERKKVTYEEYRELYNYLKDKDKGANLIDRFVTVSRCVTPYQLDHFMTLLPSGMIKALKRYKEFYELNTYIYRQTNYMAGQKMKAPGNARQGLTKDAFEKKLKDELNSPDDFKPVIIEAAPRVTDDDGRLLSDIRAKKEPEEFTELEEVQDAMQPAQSSKDMDMRAYANMVRQRRQASAAPEEGGENNVKNNSYVALKEEDEIGESSLVDMLNESATNTGEMELEEVYDEPSGKNSDVENLTEASQIQNVSDMSMQDILQMYS